MIAVEHDIAVAGESDWSGPGVDERGGRLAAKRRSREMGTQDSGTPPSMIPESRRSPRFSHDAVLTTVPAANDVLGQVSGPSGQIHRRRGGD